jgi:hypothetical protein
MGKEVAIYGTKLKKRGMKWIYGWGWVLGKGGRRNAGK